VASHWLSHALPLVDLKVGAWLYNRQATGSGNSG
jgi:hypothetical protein